MSDKPASLAAALAAFQANLPTIVKSETAEVRSDKGSYKYGYADLAQVSGVVLPMLGELGLSFSAKPTFNADGKFVLAYRLLHECGDSDSGEYMLPQTGTPQQIGSAITYARRYTLCAITGAAAGGDDDDGHEGAKTGRASANERWEDASSRPPQPAGPEPERATAAQRARHIDLSKKIVDADSKPSLEACWEELVAAYKADEITTTQANILKAEITQRIAEFAPKPESAEPEPDPLADATRRKLFALFGEVFLKDENAQRDFASQTLGRTVESRSSITEQEALKLIKVLDTRKKAMAGAS